MTSIIPNGTSDGDPVLTVTLAGSITTPDDHRGALSSVGYLPTLPFEIQFAILSQIPVRQLFTLRRVSPAWNHMLKNSILLEGINKQLPYLTTAPDLMSRMKRRMRMVRGEPVWIKTIAEVLPWTKQMCGSGKYDTPEMAKIWKGFVVFLERFHGLRIARRVHDPVIKLKIEALGAKPRRMFPAVEVDVLADFMRTYPTQYHTYFKCESPGGVTLITGMKFRLPGLGFSIEDGNVVVFLAGGQWSKGENSVPDFIFFFIYSIPTGNLVQHICLVTHNPRDIGSDPLDFRYCRASKTHFLALCKTCNISLPDRNEEKYIGIYWAFIYSLHDGSLVQQIRIGPPTPTKMYGSRLRDFSGQQFQFDHLARIWFPEGQTPRPFTVSYFGTGPITGPCTLCIPVTDLPRVACGGQGWIIVPTVPSALERHMSRNIIFNSAMKSKDFENGDPMEPATVQYGDGIINIHDGRLCMLHFQTEFIPEYSLRSNRQHRLLNLPTINADQNLMGNITDKLWFTRMNIHKLRTINSLDKDHPDIDINFIPRIGLRAFLVPHTDYRQHHPEVAVWGFVDIKLQPGMPSSNSGTDLVDFVNFCVLPLHDNDIYYHDGPRRTPMRDHEQCTATFSTGSEEPDGISTSEQTHSPQDQSNQEGINRGATAFQVPTADLASAVRVMYPEGCHPHSGDDGLVCWEVCYLTPWESGSTSRELLLVCYEEAWAL